MMNIQTIIIPAEFDLDDLDLDDEIVDKAKKAFIERLEKRRLKEPKKEIKEVTPIKNNVVSLSKYKNKK